MCGAWRGSDAMLIDTHCHLDQLADPEGIAARCEETKLRTIAVTNLPAHYAIAADRLRGFRHVHAALGLHPLAAGIADKETAAFRRLAAHTNWIGEIGLDFSKQGLPTRDSQVRMFEEALRAIADRPRFITLHSRGAESEVLDALERHSITSAIFHWFTGSEAQLKRVLESGHYVSVNPAMLSSASGLRVLGIAPRDRILGETDAPHVKVSGRIARPQDVAMVYEALARHWQMSMEAAADQCQANFDRIMARVTSP